MLPDLLEGKFPVSSKSNLIHQNFGLIFYINWLRNFVLFLNILYIIQKRKNKRKTLISEKSSSFSCDDLNLKFYFKKIYRLKFLLSCLKL